MKFAVCLVLAILLSSCSRKSDAELFTDAKTLEERKDFQTAVERYEEIVDRMPTSPYAESSLVRLAMLYTNEVKDTRKAINAYRRCYTSFPNDKQAPTMLFLTAFLYNNDLHQVDTAKILYESFLQKYPDHELAQSAKFEIATLGKDPGQMLNVPVAVGEASDTLGKKKVSKR